MKCQRCKQDSNRISYLYDAFWCHSCNLWLEEKCKDSTCVYCKDRPSVPMILPQLSMH